jgi:hypothetical protein
MKRTLIGPEGLRYFALPARHATSQEIHEAAPDQDDRNADQ